MGEHVMKDIFNDILQSIKDMVDTDTIIGKPIVTDDGTQIIPVSKVSFGFASGGSDFDSKRNQGVHFGGGSGSGLTVSPICFLVIQGDNVKILQVTENVSTLERTLALAPEVIERIGKIFKKNK